MSHFVVIHVSMFSNLIQCRNFSLISAIFEIPAYSLPFYDPTIQGTDKLPLLQSSLANKVPRRQSHCWMQEEWNNNSVSLEYS